MRKRHKGKTRLRCFCQEKIKSNNTSRLEELQFLCDCRIVDREGEEHAVHRIELRVLGKQFQKNFHLADKPKIINIDAPTSATNALIDFAYMKKCNIDSENINDILAIAKTHKIRELLKFGANFVLSHLTPENALDMYKIAHQFFCLEVKDDVKLFILANFRQIHQTSGHKLRDFPAHFKEDFLRDDMLNMTEEELFKTILTWYDHEACQAAMLKHVRFTLMSQEYFEQNVATSPIATDKRAAKWIQKATKYFRFLPLVRSSTKEQFFAHNRQTFRIPHEVVFVTGGQKYSYWAQESVASIESFDIRTQKWNSLNLTLPAKRAEHGMAVLDNKIYVFGGREEHRPVNTMTVQGPVNTMIAYDPIENKWEQRANMHHDRRQVASAVLDGKIYAIGGFSEIERFLQSAECYDPQTNRWTLLPPMNHPRMDAAAVACGGRIFVFGGRHRLGNDTVYVSTTEIYNPAEGKWTEGPEHFPRSGLQAVAHQGRIFIIGGQGHNGYFKIVECLDTNRIHLQIQFMSDMLKKRANFGATVIENKILVIGGKKDGRTRRKETEILDPETNSWTEGPCLSTATSDLCATTLCLNSAFLPTYLDKLLNE